MPRAGSASTIGPLIERVTGTSIVRQLQRRLIRPLGPRHTWFPEDTAALPPPRLHGYMPLDDRPPLVDGRLLPRRLLAEMLAPNDTGVPGWSYGLGLEEYTLPCGAVAVGHTGALPGYSSGSFRLLGDDKGTGGGQPPPRPGCLVRGLLQRPGGAVLRHDPGSGSRPG